MKYGRIAAQTGAAPSNGKISLINDKRKITKSTGCRTDTPGAAFPMYDEPQICQP
jgi:hypothetical protein